LGFGKANNLARSRVRSDLVLFLNPDTELLENSLEPMVEFMRQHPDVGAVGCKMRYPNGEVHEQGIQCFTSPWTEFMSLVFISKATRGRLRSFFPYLDPNQSGYVVKLYGGCLLCRKEVLEKVGWFDERYFMYAEDVDLCREIVEAGWKLYYLSTAEIIHVAGGSSQKAPSGFSILMKCESIAKLMNKHYGLLGACLYRVGTLCGCGLRLIALGILRLASWVSPLGRRTNFSDSFRKYRIMILWCLKLQQPPIPGRSRN